MACNVLSQLLTRCVSSLFATRSQLPLKDGFRWGQEAEKSVLFKSSVEASCEPSLSEEIESRSPTASNDTASILTSYLLSLIR